MPITLSSLTAAILSVLSLFCSGGGGGKTDLQIISMLPYPDYKSSASTMGQRGGQRIVPAINLALEQINARPDILSDYTLHLYESVDGCNHFTDTFVSFAKIINSAVDKSPVKVAVIGPKCSDSVLLLSPLLSHNAFPTVSIHLGNIPHREALSLSKYSFGIVDSLSTGVKLLVELVLRNNWKKVSVLYSESDVHFYVSYQEFIAELRNHSEHSIEFSAPIYKTYIPLQELKDSYTRVVLSFTGGDISMQLMCMAYHAHMTFPTYQWLHFGGWVEGNLREVNFSYNGRAYYCSGEELREAVTGVLTVNWDLQVADDVKTYSNLTYSEYIERYEEKLSGLNATISANPAYDAVWALALALNASDELLKRTKGISLADFEQHRKDMTGVIAQQLYNVSFTGVSGKILFDNKTGFTDRTLHLRQLNKSSSKVIAIYSRSEGLALNGEENLVSSEFATETVHVLSLAGAICILTITSIPLFVAVLTQITSIAYRRYQPIKASSYRLNQIAYPGCYLASAGIILSTVLETFYLGPIHNALCATVPWCLSIGLTLVLGTMCVKSWRLYRIYSASSKLQPITNQLYLKDPMLSLGVLALVTVDVLICLLWTILDQPTWSEHSNKMIGGSTPVKQVLMTCTSEQGNIWLSAEIVYKGLISLLAFVFALNIQRGSQKGFEAKSVILLAYIQAVVSGFITPSALIISIGRDAFLLFAILSGYFLVVLYLCVTLLFVPPVVSLLRGKLTHTFREESFWSTRPRMMKSISKGNHSHIVRPTVCLRLTTCTTNYTFDQPASPDSGIVHVETPV